MISGYWPDKKFSPWAGRRWGEQYGVVPVPDGGWVINGFWHVSGRNALHSYVVRPPAYRAEPFEPRKELTSFDTNGGVVGFKNDRSAWATTGWGSHANHFPELKDTDQPFGCVPFDACFPYDREHAEAVIVHRYDEYHYGRLLHLTLNVPTNNVLLYVAEWKTGRTASLSIPWAPHRSPTSCHLSADRQTVVMWNDEGYWVLDSPLES